MKIYKDLAGFESKNPVITIGTFDGLHLGHRKIISRLKDISDSINGESVIFTFDPHPRKIVSPNEKNLRLLTTLDEKVELFRNSGVDNLIVYPFTSEFAQLTYSEFVEQILVAKIHTKCLVVGYDHRFGKDRQGGFDFLKNCSEKFGFQIEKLDVLLMNESNVSSTKIREAIQQGDFETANSYLGYSFVLNGTVVEGNKLGRRIQFPTANIEASDPDKIIPGFGVYVVNVQIDNEIHQGMLNIGTRPTINNNADNRSVEVHIFNFDRDIYGQAIKLTFFKKLREERKFDSIEKLKAQLEIDKIKTISWFSENQI